MIMLKYLTIVQFKKIESIKYILLVVVIVILKNGIEIDD